MGSSCIYCGMASKVLHDTGALEPSHRKIEKLIVWVYNECKSGSYISTVDLNIETYLL